VKLAVQHASLSWLLHAACAAVAIMVAPVLPLAWLTLAVSVALQVFAARLLGLEVARGSVRDARPLAALCHAPALLPSAWVLAMFGHVLADRFAPMVFLQLWTAPFTPVIELVPRGGLRSHYVWLVAALPWIEAGAMARFADTR